MDGRVAGVLFSRLFSSVPLLFIAVVMVTDPVGALSILESNRCPLPSRR